MDASQTPVTPVPAGSYDAVPTPRRGMSSGAKWAIGIGAALVLLTIGSCVALGIALYAADTSAGPFVPTGEGIALIHIDGAIAGTGTIYDGVISPEYVLDQLDQALADSSVSAIMLRIDSPGGTVAASQEIALAVERAAGVKPVVASIGDIGASGAYMVAAQCDEIVASPGSTVGSIGVIMQIPNVSGLLEKLGVEFTVLTEGEMKDAGSPYRSVTATESAMLQEQMAMIHDQFIADVARGRGLSESEVRELATGWAWLGTEALGLGLVDSLGNYDDAVDRAAELGGIEGEPYIVTYESVYTVEDLLWGMLGLRAGSVPVDADSLLGRLALPR